MLFDDITLIVQLVNPPNNQGAEVGIPISQHNLLRNIFIKGLFTVGYPTQIIGWTTASGNSRLPDFQLQKRILQNLLLQIVTDIQPPQLEQMDPLQQLRRKRLLLRLRLGKILALA